MTFVDGVWATLGTEFLLIVGVSVIGETRSMIRDRKQHLGYSWRWECKTCGSFCASKTWPWYFHGRIARWFAQRQVWRDHEHFVPTPRPTA